MLLVLIWFILVDKTDLLGGDYPLDEDWPLGHLWKLFLLSGGVLLWSGLIIAGIGALIKSEVVKAIGSMMGYGGILGGVVNGLFVMLVLLILSLFISKKITEILDLLIVGNEECQNNERFAFEALPLKKE